MDKWLFQFKGKLGMLCWACNHSTWMVEAGEFKGFFQNGPEFQASLVSTAGFTDEKGDVSLNLGMGVLQSHYLLVIKTKNLQLIICYERQTSMQ